MIVYARINRQIEAKWYGRLGRLMEFILFDDPRLSGPLVERIPQIALCFPMRIVAWIDEQGGCQVAYKDPMVVMKEYNIDRGGHEWNHLRRVISRSLSE